MNVVAIIQARMGSTRLPGKSLMPLGGKLVIDHLVHRTQAVASVDLVMVATTSSRKDDPLAAHLEGQGVPVFRGPEDDVLKRYAEAARWVGADAVVRLTGDDPLKDPKVIERVVQAFTESSNSLDYVSNCHPPTYPEGQDTEIVSWVALEAADHEAVDDYEREHVTPHFYRNPDRFCCHNISSPVDLSELRWTLDTEADLAFFQRVFELLDDPMAGMESVISLLSAHPDISAININESRSHQYAK